MYQPGFQPYTTSGNPEWDNLLRMREEGLSRTLRQLALSTVVHGQLPGADSRTAFDLAGPLGGADPNEQERRARAEAMMQARDRNELLGAADFYGIGGAEQMHPDQLRGMLSQRRQYMRDHAGGGSFLDKLYDTVATTIGVTGIASTDAVLEVAQRIPFLGDAIARTRTVQDADRWLAMLEEGYTAELPELSKRVSTGLAGTLGYTVPATAVWKLAGLAGGVPAIAQIGARMSPLGRAAVRGLAAEWMLEGGGDAPIHERAINVGLGAAFGAAGEIGGVLGRTVTGAGLGAIAGSVAEEGDPRAMLIGAAVGAAGMNLLPGLLRRAQRSFPTRSFGGIDTEFTTHRGDPVVDADYTIIEGDIGPGSQQRQLPGPGQTYSPVHTPPAPGMPPQIEGYRGTTFGQAGPAAPPPPASPIDQFFNDLPPVQQQAGRDAYLARARAAVGQRGPVGEQLGPAIPLGAAYDLPATGAYMERFGVRAGEALPGRATDADLVHMEGDWPSPENGAWNGIGYPAREVIEQRLRLRPEDSGARAWYALDVQNDLSMGAAAGAPEDWMQAARAALAELSPVDAIAEAAQLTKHAALMESPALAELSRQPQFDDADVARAVVESFPGQVGVVRNIGDVGKTIRRILQDQMPNGVGPQDFRVVERPAVIRFYRGQPVATPPSKTERWFTTDRSVAEIHAQYDVNTGTPYPQGGAVFSVDVPEDIARTVGYGSLGGGDAVFGPEIVNKMRPAASNDWGFRREKTTDILVSAGRPITNKMVKEYETYGMFSGQRAVTAQGNEVSVVSLGPEVSTVRPLHGGEESVIPTTSLLPTKSSGIAEEAPQLYSDFEQFAQVRLDQQAIESGIPPFDLFGDEAATQMPLLLEEFLSLYGVQSQYPRAAMRAVLEQAHLQRLRDLTPVDDMAVLRTAQAEARQHLLTRGLPEADIEEIAEARGMAWVPGAGASAELHDAMSDLIVPVESEAAGRAFLQTFDREVRDLTPPSNVPFELIEPAVGFNAASDLPPRWRGAEDYAESYEGVLDTETMVLETMEEALREGEWEFTGGDFGGGGALPPAGGGSWTGEPFPALPAGTPETLGQQFQRIRRTDPRRHQELVALTDGLLSRYGLPFRNLALRIEERLHQSGATRGTLWQSYDAVETAHTRANNAAGPWLDRVTEVYKASKNRFWRDGTMVAVETAPTVNDKERIMQAAGYTAEDRRAQALIRPLLDEFYFGVAARHYPDMGYIFNYLPEVRAHQSDATMNAWDSLPDNLEWARQMFRGGRVQPRERDMGVLLNHYFRSFFKYTEMKAPYEAMRSAWNSEGVPEQYRDLVNNWLEARFWGIDPAQDKFIRGTRSALRAVGIPVTDRDVSKLISVGMTAQYRGALGGRIDPIVRDLLQPLNGAARFGFRALGREIKRFLDPAQRGDMIALAYDAGFLQRGHVQVADADIFGNTAWNEQVGEVFDPRMAGRREGIARVGDFVQDRLAQPLGLKGGMQGTKFDMLRWYAKQGDLARVLTGNAGYNLAKDAITDYVAASRGVVDEGAMRLLRDKLLDDSRVMMYPAPTKREFLRLVDAGDYEGAARLHANQTANSQLRYGQTEQPVGIREAGTVGRLAMQYGTYSQQTIAQLVEVFNDTSIPRKQRFGYAARLGAIQSALLAGQAVTGWNLRKMMLYGVAFYAGGPT